MRDVHPSTKTCWALHSWKVLSVDWACLIWMSFSKLQPGLQLQVIWWLSLDRWEVFVLHPSTKCFDSCQALLNFIDCWLSMSHLDELLRVTIRCSAVSNSVTFSRQMRDVRSSSLHNKVLTAVWHFLHFIDWWLIMICLNSLLQVTTRSSAASNSLTFSWQMRGAHSSSTKKPRQLSSTFEFYWLMTDHVSFEWAFTSYNQVFSCKQFGDIDWLNACQAAKVIHKCYAWMPQRCLCPYMYWSMLGVHANAKAEDWLGATYSRYKGAQTLAVSSSSCWCLKGESKFQPSTFSWVLSGDQWVADLSKMISSLNHQQVLSVE